MCEAPTTATPLHQLSWQSPQERHEPDQENWFESDTYEYDFFPLSISSRRALGSFDFDFDLGVDGTWQGDADLNQDGHLLTP